MSRINIPKTPRVFVHDKTTNMFSQSDPLNPMHNQERNWFKPAFPHVRRMPALVKWSSSKHFKLLTRDYTEQAATAFMEDYLKMSKDHVKSHVAQVVTSANAAQGGKAARNFVLTMLDLHPTGEMDEKKPVEGSLDAMQAGQLALYGITCGENIVVPHKRRA